MIALQKPFNKSEGELPTPDPTGEGGPLATVAVNAAAGGRPGPAEEGDQTPDVIVEKILQLDRRLARNEDEAVRATIEKGEHLNDLKACARRTWGKRLGELGLKPRVASRLMAVGRW